MPGIQAQGVADALLQHLLRLGPTFFPQCVGLHSLYHAVPDFDAWLDAQACLFPARVSYIVADPVTLKVTLISLSSSASGCAYLFHLFHRKFCATG